MENFVGAPMGIEPVSPAFWAGVLTTTPQHPGTKYIKFASSNHPWQLQLVLQHMLLLLQCFHNVREPLIRLYRHNSPDQLIRQGILSVRNLSYFLGHKDINCHKGFWAVHIKG